MGRRPLRAARPPLVQRQAVRRHPARPGRPSGGQRPRRQRDGHLPGPREHPSRSGPARRSGRAGAPPPARPNSSESCVRPTSRSSTAGRCSISCCSGSAATGTCCPCSRARPPSNSKDWALAIPAPTHIEPHVERVTLNPAILAVARQILVVMHGAGKAGDPRRHLRPGASTRPAGRRSSRAATGRRGSSTRRRPPACPRADGRCGGRRRPTIRGRRSTIRRAEPGDAGGIGDVWLTSWRATFDFEPSHPDDDVRRWLATELVPRHETWVAVEPRRNGRRR